jgi:ATP-binding cassette subfamily B protein
MADASRALAGLIRLGARRRPLLIAAVTAGSLSAILTLVPPVVVARLAEGLLGPDPARTAVWPLVGIAAAAIALRVLLLAGAYVASHVAAFAILYDLRIMLVTKLGRVPLGFVTDRSSGALKKILGDDVDRIEGFVADLLIEATMAIAGSLAGAILLFWVDWRLALATLGPLPLALALQMVMFRGAGPMMAAYVAASEAMNGALVQYVQGIGVIKAFGRGAYAPLDDGIARFGDLLAGFVRRVVPAWAAFQVAVKASLLFLLPIGGWLSLTGRISIADLLLALLVGLGLIPPLLTLMHAGGNLRLIAQGIDRIDTILATPDLARGGGARPADASISFAGSRFPMARARR